MRSHWARLVPISLIVAAGGLALLGMCQNASRRGSAPPITRCPIHGIAYDVNLEVCPDCAKLPPPS